MSFLTGDAGIAWLKDNAVISDHDVRGEFPVFAVAEVNPPGPMEHDWLRYDSTCNILNIQGHWRSSLNFWAVDVETGVLARWKRFGTPRRVWVFQVLATAIERLSPEKCVEIARRMAAPRAPALAIWQWEEWNGSIGLIQRELDRIREITEERTTLWASEQQGPTRLDLYVLHTLCADLIEMRKRLEKEWPESE